MANSSNIKSIVHPENSTIFDENKAEKLIWQIVPPILIFLGTVGNCLSIIVLTRRSIRSSTTALYLTVLAFSDIVVLYSGLLRQWLNYLFDIDVRSISGFGCKLNIWMVYSSLVYSAWILIIVTLERVVSAWLPHNARTLCTKKSALALLISVGVFILGLNAHLLYGMVLKYSYDENGNAIRQKCSEINKDYYDFFNVTWPWIDFCAFCLIPFTVIVIGNAMILVKVLTSRRKLKSQVVPMVPSEDRQPVTTSLGKKQSSMPAMLFTLNIVFLFSTLPVTIYNIGYPYWIIGASEYDYAKLDLWWAVVNMLMYVNNSLNFFLYCLSGTKFRREFFRIVCSWRQKKGKRNVQGADHSRRHFDIHFPSSTVKVSTIAGMTQHINSKHTIDTNNEQNELTKRNTKQPFRHTDSNPHRDSTL